MGLSEKMRRLIERNAEFTVPLEVGDPGSTLTVGSIIDITSVKRPTIGHLTQEPFGIHIGKTAATGLLDIRLGLSRLVTASFGSAATVSPSEDVAVGLRLKSGRDVVLSLVPAKGKKLEGLLPIASALVKHTRWNHKKYVFVFRTFAVKSARMHMAKKGDGEITLRGKAKAVSKVVSGEFDASVTWETKNVITETIDAPGVLGVHCARVLKNGSLKFI